MGIFSLFKRERTGTRGGRRRAEPDLAAAGRIETGGDGVADGGAGAGAQEEAGIGARLEKKGTSLLEAIGLVGEKVEKSSGQIQKTVLETASEQSSIIQGIYRLIDERTMDRADLNKRRREAWRVISESLSDVRLELGEILKGIKDGVAAPDVIEKLEEIIASTRAEGQSSRERLEEALGRLRDAQSARLDAMLEELREAERERVDSIVAALREEAEKRVAEVKRAGEIRVFDAIRSGDERIADHRALHRERLADLEAAYHREFEKLEASYRQIARDKDRRRHDVLREILGVVDAVETRLQAAAEDLESRERALVVVGEGEEVERRAGFFEKLFGSRAEKEREALAGRVQAIELSLLEARRSHRAALEDLHRALLDALEREGVERMHTAGERYDPEAHIAVEEAGGDPPGRILRERRRGYRAGGEVLRKAEVVVTRVA